MRPIHLKWRWSETAHDEVAVTISGTVQVTLLICSQIIARDHDPVRMWVRVEVHELWFAERRFDSVVAGGLVRRVPVSHGWAGDDVKGIAFFGQLRAVESHPGGRFFGVDFSCPAGNR